jgi:hypothetical protein
MHGPMPVRRSSLVLVVFALAALAGSLAGPAEAAGPGKAARVKLVSRPGVLTVGQRATIAVTVRLPRARGRRVAITGLVQAQRGKRGFRTVARRTFVRRAKGARGVDARLRLRYRAPARAGVERVRVRVRSGKRVVTTRSFRIRVVARAARPVAPPVPQQPAQAPRPARTQVLAPGVVRSVPAPGSAGDVRVSGPVDLQPGDFIAAGIGDATPYGFLGRVVGVRAEGADTVLTTEPATLPDAVPEADMSASFVAEEIETERPDQVQRAGRAAEAPMTSTSGPGMVRVRARRSYECGAGGEVSVNAVVGVRPEVELSGSWRLFRAPNVRFVGRLVGTAELTAAASADASCRLGPVELFKRTLKPVQFSVGPIPVVVVPVLRVNLTGVGRVEGSVKTEVAGSITAEAGINYENGEAKPIGGVRRNVGFTPPTPGATGELSATASPTLDALLYGVGGPSASLNVGLKATLAPLDDVRWRLLLPISVTAKLHAPILKVSTGERTVFSREFLLAQDEDGAGGSDPIDGGGGHPDLPITFDELPLDTFVVDEYVHVGVRFTGDVMTTDDGSNPSWPVLSGYPRFRGPIEAEFVDPATGAPATVNRIQLDAGYIDSPGSVEIVATTQSGRTIRAIADDEGIDEIFLAAQGIRSFVARTVSDEPAGFAIDNLDFG